jgi:hypothetical protein
LPIPGSIQFLEKQNYAKPSTLVLSRPDTDIVKQEAHRCKSPVAFLVFNRPETTRRVFGNRESQPQKLFVVADGTRSGGEREFAGKFGYSRPSGTVNCKPTSRKSMSRNINGIDWVFDNVEGHFP